jgi:rhamnosyltransferase
MIAKPMPEIVSAPNTVIDTRVLVCITVTYHPELPILRRQFEALPLDTAIIVVDNGSASHIQKTLIKLISTRERTRLLINESNIGLAAAINQGVLEACRVWPEIRFALLLDQDSEPQSGCIERLLNAFNSLEKANISVGCVGPALLDTTTGLYHGFHQCDRWRWKRIYPETSSRTPVACANLNGSGTLLPIKLFLELGGLEERLFIDHVDTEWAFRVQSAGYSLFGIPDAVFEHRMGDDSRRIWLFGWRTWPMRSAKRHYYLFRNALILMRRDYVPIVWKMWAAIKLFITAGIHLLLDKKRIEQVFQMCRGVWHGIRNKQSRIKIHSRC